MTHERKKHALPRDQITPGVVREDLDYDPITGQFTWRAVRVGVATGARVGVVNHHGYVVISLRRHQFQAHRLAWAHYFGEFPAHQIDHINGDKSDNRLCNLRQATQSQNKSNTRVQKNSSHQVKGASWHKRDKRWVVKIQRDGIRIDVGRFKTREEAAAAYDKASLELHGEFSRGNKPLQTTT